MGNYHGGAHKAGEDEFQLILAAGLIRGFALIPPEEMYEKAVPCFESLLEIKESRDVASKVSSLIDGTAASVQKTAEAIVDRLLFNSTNNPLLSLGLPGYAGKAEAAQRWRRLIVLYHPDKYPGQKEYEERAKRINEAYREIQTLCGNNSRPWPGGVNGRLPPAINTLHYSRYLRRMPAFILALAILMAVLSVLFFVRTMQDDRGSENKGEVKTMVYPISDGLPAPPALLAAGGERREGNG